MSKSSKVKNIRHVRLIDVKLIRMDRYPMNPSTLSLIDYLRTGGEVPPIKVATHPDGGYIIRDGRHRVLAYKILGIKKIKAKYSKLPMCKRHFANDIDIMTKV